MQFATRTSSGRHNYLRRTRTLSIDPVTNAKQNRIDTECSAYAFIPSPQSPRRSMILLLCGQKSTPGHRHAQKRRQHGAAATWRYVQFNLASASECDSLADYFPLNSVTRSRPTEAKARHSAAGWLRSAGVSEIKPPTLMAKTGRVWCHTSSGASADQRKSGVRRPAAMCDSSTFNRM
jgi:hypothetical protein